MVPAKLSSRTGNDKKITKKETKKIKKIINEEARLGLNDSSSEIDDVDLTKEMFPLRHYVNDRKEMINQMFSVIYGSKLKKMLPPVLKDMPIEELKAECLIHLLGMSSKRILSVLDGKELDSSSESDTSSEKSASHESLPLTNNNKGKKSIIKQEGCSDISDDTVDVDRDLDMLEIGINKKEMGDITGDFPAVSQNKHANQKKRKGEEISTKKHKRQVVKSKSPPKKLEEKEHSGNSSEESGRENSQEKIRSSDKEKNNENIDTKQGRTLLEILELEMRARAIRALLKQDGLPEEEDTADKSNKKIDEKDVSKTSTEKNVEQHKKKKRIYRNRSLENYDGDEKAVIQNKELVTIDLTSESDTKLIKTSQTNKKQDEIYFRSNEAESKSTSCKQSSEVTEVNISDNKKNIEIRSSDYKEDVTETDIKEQNKLDINDSKNSKTDSKSSWAERWLQSKDVKKVVTTSKMCANIRKRMRNARLAKQLQNSDKTKPALSLEGSVSEYQLIKAGNSANEKSEDNGVAISDLQQVNSSSCDKQEKSFIDKEILNSNQNINSQCTIQPEISSDQAEIELELAPTENELNIDSMGDDVNINDNIQNKG